MSAVTAAKFTKKQKKALAFRERKGKGKAKSFDELDNDVPVEENQDLAEVELGAEPTRLETSAGRAAGAQKAGARDTDAVGGRHKAKKRKREDVEEADGAGEINEEGQSSEPKQTAKKKWKGMDGAGVDARGEADKDDQKGNVKQRFILFVGNLKYTISKEAIEQHFSQCDPPPTVRLMTPKPSATSKPTAKSKGFAFVEFTHRNALQQGLKLHQSELEGRKINVELTAGGGGKSEGRLEKVKRRNKALHEQRQQRISKTKGEGGKLREDDIQMERPQRYSATSGVDQVPLKTRTWSVPVSNEESASRKKRGTKKTRPPKLLGTGVNAIPVG